MGRSKCVNKYIQWSIIALVPLFLQSCTIAHYKIRNTLPTDAALTTLDSCNVRFHIVVSADPRRFSRKPGYKDAALKKDTEEFVQSTEKVLGQQGCTVAKVENAEEANFNIEIWESAPSGAGIEFLTGLSAGVIPSWGTSEGEYKFTFTDLASAKDHTYLIDEKSYNHITLVPVSWITFVLLDKQAIYKKALANFLESSAL